MADGRVKRKLAAILALDVVGFSKLMHDDDVAAFALVQRLVREVFQPAVESRGGSVFKHTGDGVLARFDSVHDAFEASEEIIQAVVDRAEASVRIGIHLGDVIDSEGDVFGDSVNIACRLESLALHNGICVSERAWSDLRQRKVNFLDLGEQRLKNISTPVRAYMYDPTGAGGDKLVPKRRKKLLLVGSLAGLALVAAAGLGWWALRPSADGQDVLASALDEIPCSWLSVGAVEQTATRERATIEGYSNLSAGRVQELLMQQVARDSAGNIQIDTTQVAALPDYNCAFVDAASEFKYEGLARAEVLRSLRSDDPEGFAQMADKLPDWAVAASEIRIFAEDFSPNAHLFAIDEADGLQPLAPVSELNPAEGAPEGTVGVVVFSDQTSPSLFFIVDAEEPIDPEQVVLQLTSMENLRSFREAAETSGWQFELVMLHSASPDEAARP